MALSTGCQLLATVHGSSIEDIRRKPVFRHLLEEQQIERYVILAGEGRAGTIKSICDRDGKVVWKCSEC